jgi:hypothetical protein
VGGEREAGLLGKPTRDRGANRESGSRHRSKAEAQTGHCSYSAAAGIDYSRVEGRPRAQRTTVTQKPDLRPVIITGASDKVFVNHCRRRR